MHTRALLQFSDTETIPFVKLAGSYWQVLQAGLLTIYIRSLPTAPLLRSSSSSVLLNLANSNCNYSLKMLFMTLFILT